MRRKKIKYSLKVASTFEFLKHPVLLVSSLFEAPPDISVEVAKAGTVVPAQLSQVTAPEGLCGWIPSETGSPDWVCQAFGQVMPGVVFFVSMSVILFSIIFLVWYYQRYRKTKSVLTDLLRELQIEFQANANANSEIQKIFSILNQSGKKIAVLAGVAARLESSLFFDEESGKPTLLKKIEELVGADQIIENWVGKNLADEIPSWLTGLGLLTTFIAILLGLQHVKVLTNLEVQGIGGLVNGLSGKFFSSIVAMSCALSITMINYFCFTRILLLWKSVLAQLEQRLPHLSAEQMLLRLVLNQRDRDDRKGV